MSRELVWHRAVPLSALAIDRPHAVIIDGVAVMLVRAENGSVCAVHDECSHHHAPLASSPVCNGIVTCRWHGWQFRLADGVCVRGGANIRSFPVEIRDDTVWVGVAPVLTLLGD